MLFFFLVYQWQKSAFDSFNGPINRQLAPFGQTGLTYSQSYQDQAPISPENANTAIPGREASRLVSPDLSLVAAPEDVSDETYHLQLNGIGFQYFSPPLQHDAAASITNPVAFFEVRHRVRRYLYKISMYTCVHVRFRNRTRMALGAEPLAINLFNLPTRPKELCPILGFLVRSAITAWSTLGMGLQTLEYRTLANQPITPTCLVAARS